MLKVRRALVSVWDKKGLPEFVQGLLEHNIEIVSTGKTALLLRKHGITVREVASVTSFPEILSGRVKTLHPKIFGGILVNKKHPLHMEEIHTHGIEPVDMVVVNLYPFTEKIKENLNANEIVEYIDIGGPSMLRAAAKNYKNVAAVSRPEQYKTILAELEKNAGSITDETLKALAQEVFYLTKEYDNVIYNYFRGADTVSWNLEKLQSLRYGENPHQRAGLYALSDSPGMPYIPLQGKELSYNNFLDLDTALSVVREFTEPAAAIVKHGSVSGVGIDKKLSHAYRKAYLVDTVSSFGGVIGMNRKVDKDTACEILKSEFKECIVAPSFSKEALKLFSDKKNMRVVEAAIDVKRPVAKDIRSTAFGYLLQDRDTFVLDKQTVKVVSKKKPSARELKDMLLAWKVAKWVKSNAIVIAKNGVILGIGGGQPSRVGSVKVALHQATENAGLSLKSAVLASDGFFPKEDSVKCAYHKGVRAFIQPGGSIKDADVIKTCDSLGAVMVFTNIRHFRH